MANEEHFPGLDAEVEEYAGGHVTSGTAPIPKWLKYLYMLLPPWGFLCFWLYWNGSHGWLDPGYWNQLQRAANTTYPFYNDSEPTEGSHQKIDKDKTP